MKIITAIIPAAGQGLRMGGAVSKQFMLLDGLPVIIHTLLRLSRMSAVTHLIPVIRPETEEHFTKIAAQYNIPKIYKIIKGGKERQDSVYSGIREMHPQTEIVLIHDAVRPFIMENEVMAAVGAASVHGGAVVGVPLVDTPKMCSDDGVILSTPARKNLWAAQTPQVFRSAVIREAYANAERQGIKATDDAMLAENLGISVIMVQGRPDNIKITTPLDMITGKAILRRQKKEQNESADRYGL